MSTLKGISLSLFLAGCLALYVAVLMLVNPTLPGAVGMQDARVAYSATILLLALACCVVAGIVWSQASRMRASTAVSAALTMWLLLLVGVFLALGVNKLPL